MKAGSPFHIPEDMRSLFRAKRRQAWQDAETLHFERNRAYQRRWGLKRRRRQRAVQMRDKAGQARSAYIAAYASVAACILLMLTLARTCERCQGHMDLDALRELHCLVCGRVVYLDRGVRRPSDVDLRVHNRADKFLLKMAEKASFSHIGEKAS